MKNKLSKNNSLLSHQTLVTVFFFILFIWWLVLLVAFRPNEKKSLFGEKSTAFNEGWYYVDSGEEKPLVLPNRVKTRVPVDENKFSRIYRRISSDLPEDFYVGFFTKNQIYSFYVDEKVVDSYTGSTYASWIPVVGTYFHMAHVENKGGDHVLCLELKASSFLEDGLYSEMTAGTSASLVRYLISRKPFMTAANVVIFILSLLIITVSYLFQRQTGKDHTLRALGGLTICVAAWLLENSYITQLLYENHLVHFLFRNLLFSTTPMALVYFVEELTGVKKDKGLGILCLMTFAVIVLQFVLHVTGLVDYSLTFFFSHVLIFATLVYVIVFALLLIKNGNRKIKPFMPSFYILCGGMLIEIIFRIFNTYESCGAMSIAFLLFFVHLGISSYKRVVEMMKLNSESEMYHQLAFTDYSTGVYNRTAYYNLVEHYTDSPTPYCLILFDMNNLKTVNDTYGHLYGDKMIHAFCYCTRKTFESFGSVYRVGGDEFIVLIKNPDVKRVERACQRFELLVKNQKMIDYKFTCAYGCIYFVASQGSDFYAAQHSADAKMYEMKADMKKEGVKVQSVNDCDKMKND